MRYVSVPRFGNLYRLLQCCGIFGSFHGRRLCRNCTFCWRRQAARSGNLTAFPACSSGRPTAPIRKRRSAQFDTTSSARQEAAPRRCAPCRSRRAGFNAPAHSADLLAPAALAPPATPAVDTPPVDRTIKSSAGELSSVLFSAHYSHLPPECSPNSSHSMARSRTS